MEASYCNFAAAVFSMTDTIHNPTGLPTSYQSVRNSFLSLSFTLENWDCWYCGSSHLKSSEMTLHTCPVDSRRQLWGSTLGEHEVRAARPGKGPFHLFLNHVNRPLQSLFYSHRNWSSVPTLNPEICRARAGCVTSGHVGGHYPWMPWRRARP